MAAAGCGLRIVAMHWGHEFEGARALLRHRCASLPARRRGLRLSPRPRPLLPAGYPTVPQMAAARALARAGADVILGAHAHVAQPVEVLLLNGYCGAPGACDSERAALAALPAASRIAGAPGPPRKALVLYSLGA
jgi:poly-gamma-glutamate capsule biosynthesis protein CapA/YwtB (metallophosphatase superfamily)